MRFCDDILGLGQISERWLSYEKAPQRFMTTIDAPQTPIPDSLASLNLELFIRGYSDEKAHEKLGDFSRAGISLRDKRSDRPANHAGTQPAVSDFLPWWIGRGRLSGWPVRTGRVLQSLLCILHAGHNLLEQHARLSKWTELDMLPATLRHLPITAHSTPSAVSTEVRFRIGSTMASRCCHRCLQRRRR